MEVTPLHHMKFREQIAKAATKEIKRIGLPPYISAEYSNFRAFVCGAESRILASIIQGLER
jgi:hypothetical protein